MIREQDKVKPQIQKASRPDSVVAAQHGCKRIEDCSKQPRTPLCLLDKCNAHQIDSQPPQIEIPYRVVMSSAKVYFSLTLLRLCFMRATGFWFLLADLSEMSAILDEERHPGEESRCHICSLDFKPIQLLETTNMRSQHACLKSTIRRADLQESGPALQERLHRLPQPWILGQKELQLMYTRSDDSS